MRSPAPPKRLAKYAATGYLEALELGSTGACDIIVNTCRASRVPSESTHQSNILAYNKLMVKNQSAACKLASLLAEVRHFAAHAVGARR